MDRLELARLQRDACRERAEELARIIASARRAARSTAAFMTVLTRGTEALHEGSDERTPGDD